MAFANFKPTIWSKHVQDQAKKFSVMEKDCQVKVEGKAKAGAELKIKGVGKPTINDYVKGGGGVGKAEQVTTVSSKLVIDQAKYFHTSIDDIDEAQAGGDLPDLLDEASEGLTDLRDAFITKNCVMYAKHKLVQSITNTKELQTVLDYAIRTIWKTGVKTGIVIYLPPEYYMMMLEYLTEVKTENGSVISKSEVGGYRGTTVKLSNNLEDGTQVNKQHIIVKTKRAVAFAACIDKVEAYRPEDGFEDALKGLNCYGCKVVRPIEVVVIEVDILGLTLPVKSFSAPMNASTSRNSKKGESSVAVQEQQSGITEPVEGE